VTRYADLMEHGPGRGPVRVLVRIVDAEGYHVRFEDWTSDEAPDVVLYAGACHTMEGRPMDEFELELEAVIRRFIEQGLDRDDIRASLIEAADALDDTPDQPDEGDV